MPIVLTNEQLRNILPLCSGKRVAVFGAGDIGAQLVAALQTADCDFVGIFDDYSSPGQSIGSVPVMRAKAINTLRPHAVVLATLKARKRMTQRLHAIGYQGIILSAPGKDYDPFAADNCTSTTQVEALRNHHVNQPAFIIGNGTSLLKTDPRRIKNAVTFACNSIFLLPDFTPTYYCVEDILVAQDRAEAINALPWIKFFPHDLKPWLNNAFFFNGFRVPAITSFSEDVAQGMQVNATVTYTMLQLAFYMGCDPVYLIGLDHSYQVGSAQADLDRNILTSKTDDPNHFHPDYFGKGLRWHDPRLDRMETAYRLARAAFEKHGRHIYNTTAGGKLEIFSRIDFENIVGL